MKYASESKVVAPDGGWKDNTMYLVRVAFSDASPIETAFLFSGVARAGGRWDSEFYHPNWIQTCDLFETFYLEVVEELPEHLQLVTGA